MGAIADGVGDAGDQLIEVTIEESMEARKPRKVADPIKPSAREVEEHELTHLPYRSWCWTCVHGRGKHAPHVRTRKEKTALEVHFDFMFVGPKDQLGLTVSSEHVDEPVCDPRLEEVGCKHQDVIVKSDQEASINSLVDEVGKMREVEGSGRWVKEHSPVGSSASNGLVEMAIQSVQGVKSGC